MHRAITDDALGWGLNEQLLAMIADALHVANWQRSGDKKIPYPQRIPRPGVVEDTVTTDTKIGTVRPVEEIRSLLGRRQEESDNGMGGEVSGGG